MIFGSRLPPVICLSTGLPGYFVKVRPSVLETAETLNLERSTLNTETEKREEVPVECEETILPEVAPETEAAPVPTGDALVSSGVEAQAEAEPGADSTSLPIEAPPEAAPEPLEVPEPVPPTEAPTPKAKTKPAGKAGKK